MRGDEPINELAFQFEADVFPAYAGMNPRWPRGAVDLLYREMAKAALKRAAVSLSARVAIETARFSYRDRC